MTSSPTASNFMTVMRHSFVLLAVLGACLLDGRPARAEGDAERKAAAEALFSEGRELMKAGDLPAACEKFEKSEALDSATGTLLNLADCYEKAQRVASAWATYKRAAAAAREREQEKREQFARERAAALEPLLSRLTVMVPAPADGMSVTRDGTEVLAAIWGQPVPVDGGTITVRAVAPGKLAWETSVEVRSQADAVTVTVPALDADPAAVEPPAPPTSPPRAAPRGAAASAPPPVTSDGPRPDHTAPYVLTGLGGVAIAASVGFGTGALLTNGASEDYCSPDDRDRCSSRGVALRDDARTYGNIATATFVVGTVSLAGALVLGLAGTARESRTGHGWLTVGASAAPRRGEVVLRGTF